jgi:hypothetical protein
VIFETAEFLILHHSRRGFSSKVPLDVPQKCVLRSRDFWDFRMHITPSPMLRPLGSAEPSPAVAGEELNGAYAASWIGCILRVRSSNIRAKIIWLPPFSSNFRLTLPALSAMTVH